MNLLVIRRGRGGEFDQVGGQPRPARSPFEIGVVRAIHVHDGQNVRQGDLLIELDPTIGDAEREHIHGDLIAAQLDVARLRAALADGSDPLAGFQPPEGASAALIATQRRFLLSRSGPRKGPACVAAMRCESSKGVTPRG